MATMEEVVVVVQAMITEVEEVAPVLLDATERAYFLEKSGVRSVYHTHSHRKSLKRFPNTGTASEYADTSSRTDTVSGVTYSLTKCLKNSASVDPAIKYEGSTNWGEGATSAGAGTDGFVEITAIRDTHSLGTLISNDNPLYYTSENLIGLKIEPESGSSGFDSSSDPVVTTAGSCSGVTQNVFDYDSYSVIYLEVTTDCEVTVTIPESSFTTADGA